ncbi:MAG TPA: BolA/IbaG family iron-sulfur metabolism protein [Myxococcota bacterium]|nr:BolA/IbaG family iron-sulfur metabolism protein [Myxococcota bacterium]
MALQIHPPPSEVIEKLRDAIAKALPCDALEVRGSGGHFEIRVASSAFAGKNTLARQRLVLGAIAHLMKGEGAPVHAIDVLETRAP